MNEFIYGVGFTLVVMLAVGLVVWGGVWGAKAYVRWRTRPRAWARRNPDGSVSLWVDPSTLVADTAYTTRWTGEDIRVEPVPRREFPGAGGSYEQVWDEDRAGERAITGVGFPPDLVVVRPAAAPEPALYTHPWVAAALAAERAHAEIAARDRAVQDAPPTPEPNSTTGLPAVITDAWLEQHGACRDGLASFRRTFPDGAPVTVESLDRAYAANDAGGYHVGGLFEMAATPNLRAAWIRSRRERETRLREEEEIAERASAQRFREHDAAGARLRAEFEAERQHEAANFRAAERAWLIENVIAPTLPQVAAEPRRRTSRYFYSNDGTPVRPVADPDFGLGWQPARIRMSGFTVEPTRQPLDADPPRDVS